MKLKTTDTDRKKLSLEILRKHRQEKRRANNEQPFCVIYSKCIFTAFKCSYCNIKLYHHILTQSTFFPFITVWASLLSLFT